MTNGWIWVCSVLGLVLSAFALGLAVASVIDRRDDHHIIDLRNDMVATK